jgi:bacterioferritin-associated ferredoxin
VVICHCRAVNDRAIRDVALAVGSTAPEQITAVCGAGGHCGGCLPALREVLAELACAGARTPEVSAA